MGKKRKENKAKKHTSRKRGGLWVASAVVALALFVGAWVYTESRSRSLENEPKAGSAYVRRETKLPLSPALFVGSAERKCAPPYGVPRLGPIRGTPFGQPWGRCAWRSSWRGRDLGGCPNEASSAKKKVFDGYLTELVEYTSEMEE